VLTFFKSEILSLVQQDALRRYQQNACSAYAGISVTQGAILSFFRVVVGDKLHKIWSEIWRGGFNRFRSSSTMFIVSSSKILLSYRLQTTRGIITTVCEIVVPVVNSGDQLLKTKSDVQHSAKVALSSPKVI